MNAYIKKPKWFTNQGFSNPSGSRFRWRNFLVGLFAVIILAAGFTVFETPIKNGFYYATSPFLHSFWNVGQSTNNFFAPIFGGNSLVEENNNIKQENEKLLSQITSLQSLLKENQAIKEVIENTKTDNLTLLAADTVGFLATKDTVLINRGSEDDIKENMPVILSTKVLIGKVVGVYSHFSQVMLISSDTSVVDAKIQDQDITKPPVYGAIKGNGNLSMYLDLVSSDAQIDQQNVVVTSGQEGIFPKDLLIGKITAVHKNDAKPFQTADIAPFFNGNEVGTLFVITDYLKK